MPDFDVVVVDAGSSGCVVAGHLCSQSDLSLCLLEAGPDYGPADGGRWPPELLDPRTMPFTHDWGYAEERATGGAVALHRARVMGG